MVEKMKSCWAWIVLGYLISGVVSPLAFAGRVLYIPPVFSNKDWACPSININDLTIQYNFTLTNISGQPQSVTLTAQQSGTFVQMWSAGQQNLPADTSTTPSWTGVNALASFSEACDSAGCSFSWGSTSPPAGGGDTGNAAPFYHAEAVFRVNITEDRGAILGRMTQNIQAFPAYLFSTCKDYWTTPQVVVELNGGRAF